MLTEEAKTGGSPCNCFKNGKKMLEALRKVDDIREEWPRRFYKLMV